MEQRQGKQPEKFESELNKLYQQGGMMWVLLIAVSELPGHEDSLLILCVFLVVRGRLGSGKGLRLTQ